MSTFSFKEGESYAAHFSQCAICIPASELCCSKIEIVQFWKKTTKPVKILGILPQRLPDDTIHWEKIHSIDVALREFRLSDTHAKLTPSQPTVKLITHAQPFPDTPVYYNILVIE